MWILWHPMARPTIRLESVSGLGVGATRFRGKFRKPRVCEGSLYHDIAIRTSMFIGILAMKP